MRQGAQGGAGRAPSDKGALLAGRGGRPPEARALLAGRGGRPLEARALVAGRGGRPAAPRPIGGSGQPLAHIFDCDQPIRPTLHSPRRDSR